jgi:hypothetical protein
MQKVIFKIRSSSQERQKRSISGVTLVVANPSLQKTLEYWNPESHFILATTTSVPRRKVETVGVHPGNRDC